VKGNEKELYDENIELLRQMKEHQIMLCEKETYFLSLNVIIDNLKDKRDFDLNLNELIARQKANSDANDSIKNRGLGINREIGHIRDKVGPSRKKAKLEELEKKVGRFIEGKADKSIEGSNGIGAQLSSKFDEVGCKEASDIDPADLDKHAKELKSIGTNEDRQEKDTERNEDEL
jgi:hypothetical protein